MKRVRETLGQLDGVTKVDVDFQAKVASVAVKKDARLEKDVVVAALKGKGYGVSSFDAPAVQQPSEYVIHVSGMT